MTHRSDASKVKSQKSLNTFVFNGLALALKQAWCWHDWEHSSAWTQEAILNLWLSPWIIIKKIICPCLKSPWHHSTEKQNASYLLKVTTNLPCTTCHEITTFLEISSSFWKKYNSNRKSTCPDG